MEANSEDFKIQSAVDPRANVHLTCALFGNSLETKANRVKQIFTSLLTLLLLTLRNKNNVFGVLFAQYSSKA